MPTAKQIWEKLALGDTVRLPCTKQELESLAAQVRRYRLKYNKLSGALLDVQITSALSTRYDEGEGIGTLQLVQQPKRKEWVVL